MLVYRLPNTFLVHHNHEYRVLHKSCCNTVLAQACIKLHKPRTDSIPHTQAEANTHPHTHVWANTQLHALTQSAKDLTRMSSTLSAGAHCAALLLHCRSAVTMKSLPTCDPACLTTSCPGTGVVAKRNTIRIQPADQPNHPAEELTNTRRIVKTCRLSSFR